MKRLLLTAALLAAWTLTPAYAQQGGSMASASALSQEQVRQIQQRLDELGFNPGPVDGIWGEQTRAALQQFQQAHGLEASGEPAGPTLSELGVQGGGEGQAGAAMTGSGAAMTDRGMEVTGIVTRADDQSGEIVIDGQTYVMPQESGTAMMPAEGDRVTLNYREEGGQKVITRIGQPEQ